MSPLGRMLVSTTLVIAFLARVAGTASAQTATLQGENLVAPFGGLTVTSNCNQLGNSTVSYHAEGTATGPYPGTFDADGTITIGPQTIPARPPTLDSEGTFMGPILTLTETFTILSGATTISGSKELTAPITGEQERATCQNLTFFGGITGTGRIVEVEAATLCEATINEPLGTFTDSGRATPVLTLVQMTAPVPLGRSANRRAAVSISSSRSRTRRLHPVTRTTKAAPVTKATRNATTTRTKTTELVH